jgi:uncharacterized protein (TIGR02300 family)
VTKAELGTKRLCPNSGARYYDLNRDPIVCPRCGTEFEVAVTRLRPQAASKAPKEVAEEESEDTAAAELVSLEEADDEAAESGAVKVPGADDEDIETDDDEDDTFLADEEEDEDEDVGDIIGDVEEDDT